MPTPQVGEAESVMREVVAHYEGTPKTGQLAMAMTNLAIILLKAAAMDERRDRIQEAVDLCRRALPLRPKTEDPYGWAFSAANLALALTRLGGDDPATRRSHLDEAAAVSQEAAGILDAHGDVTAADQARVNRLDALLGLVGELRNERLRTVVGVDETIGDPTRSRAFSTINPAAFGMAETPPAVAEVVRGPAAPDEAQILKTVLDEAAALLAEPRAALDPAFRARLARLTVRAWPTLLGADAGSRGRGRRGASPYRRDGRARCRSGDGERAGQSPRPSGPVGRRPRLPLMIASRFTTGCCRTTWTEDRVVQTLARFPTLARWTAYAHVRSGDPQTAVTILERTRSRSLPRFVPGAGRRLELLSWRSATLDDVGRAATPTCPIAYVLTAPAGSVVLLVRRDDDGHVTVTAYENPLSAGFFVARMFSNRTRTGVPDRPDDERGHEPGDQVAHGAARVSARTRSGRSPRGRRARPRPRPGRARCGPALGGRHGPRTGRLATDARR